MRAAAKAIFVLSNISYLLLFLSIEFVVCAVDQRKRRFIPNLAGDSAARASTSRQAGGEAVGWDIIAKMARMGANDLPRPSEPEGMML
jgi:hypothetical protein